MSRTIQRLRLLIVKLYPRAWRERYGDEFAALLEDTPARWRDLPDITKGALVMRLHQQSWKTVALTGGVGLALAVWGQPANFASTARIHASDPKVVPYLSLHALSASALNELAGRFRLYEAYSRRHTGEEIVSRMRQDIRVEVDAGDASQFTVQFQYPDAQKARAVTNALVGEYIFENQRESLRSSIRSSTLDQVRPADLSNQPHRDLSPVSLFWGLGLGVLAGVIILKPKLAGLAVVGSLLAAGPFYLISSRYMSTMVISVKTPVNGLADVQLTEIPMPTDTPRVYRVSAVHTDAAVAQRALVDAFRKLPFESKAIIEGPTLSQSAVSPNHLIPALCGAIAAMLYGVYRRRH